MACGKESKPKKDQAFRISLGQIKFNFLLFTIFN